MNLAQLLTDVETELQYAPDLAKHRADFRNVINRVYQDLGRERDWPWLYRRAPLWVLPTFEVATGGGGVTLTIGGGPRSFSLPRNLFRSALGFTSNQQLTAHLQSLLAGGQVDIASGDRTVGDGNWEKAPFVIERVQFVSPDSGATTIGFDLDPRCSISSFLGTEGNLEFSFPRHRLPNDLDELIAIRDDQGNEMRALLPQQEREYLVRDVEGQSPAYVLEDGGFVPNEGFILGQSGSHGGAVFEHTPFNNQTENWPVRETFTVGASVAVGTMAVGTKVRLMLSWYYSGRFGPPSEVVEFTVTDQRGVRITGIPLLPQTTATHEYGRRVAVFMAEGEGAYFFRGLHTSATANTFEITEPNTSATAADVGLRLPRWDELYPGRYQYVRLYPAPNRLVRLELEYHARPRTLVEPTDAPEFHEPYHPLLVWLAVQWLAARFADEPTLKRATFEVQRIRGALDAKYPRPRHTGRQKGMIGRPRANRAWQPFGVNWNGDI